MQAKQLLVAGTVLIGAGVLSLLSGASLGVFLVTVCDNRFWFSDAPSLRCLQPVLWQIGGVALLALGVVAGAVGLSRRRSRPRS